MKNRRTPKPTGRTGRLLSAAALVLGAASSSACAPSPVPGESEEVATPEKDVPAVVLEAAELSCERLGGARLGDWYWDQEDNAWEVTLGGLTRLAELDILPDGTFSELELVYGIEEIEAVLPDIAKLVRSKCRGDEGVVIELSLRLEQYLDDIPDLERAWNLSGVVLEFQCPNGRDVEIDARGMIIEKPVDDTDG